MQQKNGFPSYEHQAHGLVQQHVQIRDEPLLLAVYYASERKPHDVFLFEVVDGFGGNDVAPEGDLFEVEYASTGGFPLQPDQRLHLILTNPNELQQALHQKWQRIDELRSAKKQGQWRVLYKTPQGESLEKQL